MGTISRKKLSKRSVALAIAIPLLIVSLIIWLLLRGIWNSNGIGGRPTVPVITGMSVESAEELLLDDGFTLVIDGERKDEVYGNGMIVSQDPPAEETLRRGGDIHVVLSSGLTEVGVPGLLNLSLDEAERALENNGLKIGDVEYTPSEADRDTVIRQSLSKGSVWNRAPPWMSRSARDLRWKMSRWGPMWAIRN